MEPSTSPSPPPHVLAGGGEPAGHLSGPASGPGHGGAPGTEAAVLERALFEVKRVIVGQERVIERLFVCLLAQGHCLLEGVPGLAKTLAMETLAKTVGGTFSRIQFTPDLLPADIVGTRIYRHSSEAFDVELGPVFANFVLADEVNRAPAKVQSALLEVMAERQVSIAGRTYQLPEPFLVLATQNPIESEGVYPLPEAQRDRFLMKVLVDYPTPGEEVAIVQRMGVSPPTAEPVIDPADLARLQQVARELYVDRGVIDYAVNLVLATRNPVGYGLDELAPFIEYGASPRASLGLVAAGRALALLRGRRYVLPQDVFDVAPEILRHRIVLTYEALAQGLVVDQLTARILGTVPAPRVTPTLEAAPSPERWAPPVHAAPVASSGHRAPVPPPAAAAPAPPQPAPPSPAYPGAPGAAPAGQAGPAGPAAPATPAAPAAPAAPSAPVGPGGAAPPAAPAPTRVPPTPFGAPPAPPAAPAPQGPASPGPAGIPPWPIPAPPAREGEDGAAGRGEDAAGA